MMGPIRLPPPADGWEEQGRRAAHSLDDVTAALVVGEDAEAAARVALGIARIQALHRRVAVGDLVGDLEPLAIPGDEDPHGLADCFLYGASLNRIARPLADSQNAFILPSGSEPVATAEILGHERWQRLAAGFAEVEALLLLVARPDAPALRQLAALTDGAIVVGGAALEGISTLGRIRAPLRLTKYALGESQIAREGAGVVEVSAVSGNERRGVRPPQRRRRWPYVAAAAAVLILAAGAASATYLRARPTSPLRSSTVLAAIPDSARGSVLDASAAGAPPVTITNPQDSSIASAFAVEVVKANTQSGAVAHLRDEGAHLPTITVVPVTLSDGSRWYRVLAGAFRTAASAESLLVSLRASEQVAEGRGVVLRAPFAVLATADADTLGARREIARLRERGLPAYGLLQPSGTVHVYIGAFESAEAAAELEESARAAGIAPAIVYRIGRSF